MIVVCIDDSNRPEDIPLSSWVVRGKEYTIVNSFVGFGGAEIVEIAEIDLKKITNGIYGGFRASRFSAPQTNLIKKSVAKEIHSV